MLPNDFFRKIAFDALPSSVPVGNNAIGIEHVERIVGDAVHQQPKMPLALSQRVGCLVPLGDVARNLGETNELTVLVESINHDRREEFRAILAHAPALRLELPLLSGNPEGTGRQTRLAILHRIEHLEVPADDLVRLISLDAFGTCVPVGNDAVEIEHVDGVVDDPLHQQAESELALEQAAPPATGFFDLDLSR